MPEVIERGGPGQVVLGGLPDPAKFIMRKSGYNAFFFENFSLANNQENADSEPD